MTTNASKADMAYAALRQAIIEQDLKPGTKLPEDEIGLPFGISRTLVRQALARLRNDGLVETGGKRTATVASPSLAEAKDIFRVRRALERETIRMVAECWSPALKSQLETHIADEAAARDNGDMKTSVRLAERFHILLAELTGNDILIGYMSQLVSRCSLILAMYGRPHSSECSVCEHGDILTALGKGDVEAAVRFMDQHVGSVEARSLAKHDTDGARLADILSRHAAEIQGRPRARLAATTE